jgi:DinB superfamily
MDDRKQALERMARSFDAFLALLDGVDDEGWSARPAGEEWSLADTVEHVVVANRGFGAAVRRAVGAPLRPDARRLADADLPKVFEGPGPAPDLAAPTGRFASRDEALAAFAASRAAIESGAADAAVDLRTVGAPHPILGPLDGVQWILFAGAHADNHVPQLRRLRARLGLPAL